VKVLITTASIAATIGGWAALSAQAPVPQASTAQASVSASGGYSSDSLPNLEPLPTLVPEPGNLGLTAGPAGSLAPATGQSSPDLPSRAEQPLRSVNAPRRVQPPAPMAITRSSR
jgi:hypothetical protein